MSSDNPRSINYGSVGDDEAYNRQQYRAQDRTKDADNPQVGPLEDRARAARRATRTNS
jgi:hypothetical protein